MKKNSGSGSGFFAVSDTPTRLRRLTPLNMSVEQVIEGRYIDRRKLLQMLKTTFGAGNFSTRVSSRRKFVCKRIHTHAATFNQLNAAINEFLTDAIKLLDLDHA